MFEQTWLIIDHLINYSFVVIDENDAMPLVINGIRHRYKYLHVITRYITADPSV